MVAASQTKEIRIIAYNGPPTALALKRRRFHSSSLTTTSLPPIPDPPYRFNAMEEVVDREPTSVMPPTRNPHTFCPSDTPIDCGPASQSSYAALEAESQLLRQSFVQKNQEGKSTGDTYKRHYGNYILWFDGRETLRFQKDPLYQRIPALPITVAKVVLFLDYEMKRPQKRKLADNTQSTSTCGIEHAKQVVSALEHYRFDTQHLYRHIPEAQVSLRTDNRIKTLEEAFAHNEPERTKKAHSLKAAGTRADTYTDDQLTQLATSGLESKGPTKIWRAMRDRAMMLTSSTTAFRGDNSRLLVWSDMYCYDVPMHAKGHGTKLRALTLIADNSKQNQSGRVDEHGAFRHFVVELCPVGAIGFLFFALFHVINSPVPNFEVDFSDPAYGDFGKREWYELFTFSSSKDCKQEMSYANHRERVKNLHEKNNVSISKVTHAGRGYTAKTARENGASSAEVKALGGWSDSGSYRACYDRALPLRAMLAAAMFDSEHPETHFLARDSLQPPAAVLALIFPWVEDELKKLDAREAANRMARDIALRHFLGLLIWLRTVIVQDAAVLYTRHPSAAIFQYPPFNSSTFRSFAAQSASAIAKAEKDVALALESLPQNIANTFTAAMSRLAIDQEIERQANQTYQDDLKSQLTVLQDLIEHNGSRTKKKRKTDGYSVSPPALPTPPPTISRSLVYPTPASSSPPLPAVLNPASHELVPDTTSLSLEHFDFDFSYFDNTVDTHPNPSPYPIFHPDQLSAIQSLQGLLPLASPSEPLPIFTAATTIALPAITQPSADPSVLLNTPKAVSASHPAASTPPARPLPVSSSITVPISGAAGPSQASSEAQVAAWQALVQKFGDTRLRNHQWEWLTAGPKPNSYLPYYTYQPVSKISDIWVEWTTGLNGFLSTRELEEAFSRPSWRRDVGSVKTERSRRKLVVDLITNLSEKRNWNIDLALRFIRDRYELAQDASGKPVFRTVRAFCDFLGKKPKNAGEMKATEKILFESSSFTA
ncbi:hypothetical protein R3P38DRAFT_3210716 [Favolaschia claudopus]|uniref:Ndc10 domain-containing protein n=1 Tax=Favolaschia claudopus TaxID=2862362 RepID=A0AAW0AH88_9AGAR